MPTYVYGLTRNKKVGIGFAVGIAGLAILILIFGFFVPRYRRQRSQRESSRAGGRGKKLMNRKKAKSNGHENAEGDGEGGRTRQLEEVVAPTLDVYEVKGGEENDVEKGKIGEGDKERSTTAAQKSTSKPAYQQPPQSSLSLEHESEPFNSAGKTTDLPRDLVTAALEWEKERKK